LPSTAFTAPVAEMLRVFSNCFLPNTGRGRSDFPDGGRWCGI